MADSTGVLLSHRNIVTTCSTTEALKRIYGSGVIVGGRSAATNASKSKGPDQRQAKCDVNDRSYLRERRELEGADAEATRRVLLPQVLENALLAYGAKMERRHCDR